MWGDVGGAEGCRGDWEGEGQGWRELGPNSWVSGAVITGMQRL